VPDPVDVDSYLPPFAPEHKLDTANVESWGNVVTQDMFCRHRHSMQQAMERVPTLLAEADRAWHERFGRAWGVVERYRCDGAGTVVVTMGSMCGTAREAIDAMRDAGESVGLVKVRLFRPLPVAALRAALGGVRDVVVLDRNHSPGAGGILHQELRAALYGMPGAPRVHGLLAGVGGVNVSPERIVEFVDRARAGDARPESVWVR
jgi:pyruvate/2-oxoacid:ferredoxin oxidoreductase alpha subunit